MLQYVLEFPLIVMTGTNDTKTTGRYFPKGPRSMRQGATRHERAHNYVRAGHTAAQALGTRCAWTVINVPGVGHDGEQMSAGRRSSDRLGIARVVIGLAHLLPLIG